MEEMRRCPYCAEEIRTEATLCRFCQSRVRLTDPGAWHRNRPERKLAGVAAAISHGLGVPLAIVRVVFIVLTLAFLHLLGPALYVALWLVIPFDPGDDTPLERGIRRLRDMLGSWQPPHEWQPPARDPSDAPRPRAGNGSYTVEVPGATHG